MTWARKRCTAQPPIPRELYERLQRIATRERRSLNDQIVKALEEHAQREEQKK